MTLEKLAQAIGADILTPEIAQGVTINRVYAGDQMTAVMTEVDSQTLLVTNLSDSMLTRPVELLDLPAICLVNGVAPDSLLANVAMRHGTAIMISPVGMNETCGRLYRALLTEKTITEG